MFYRPSFAQKLHEFYVLCGHRCYLSTMYSISCMKFELLLIDTVIWGRSRLLRSPYFARSILVMEKTQCGSKGIAHRASAASGSSKHKRKGGGKPIKVVYISNPVRVSTSAAGFRALVQELTGRHADPSKYTGSGAVDVGESSAGSPAGPQMGPAPSPGSTAESSEGAAACSHNVPATAAPAGYEYDEEDSFAPQLIDNRYSVFSPPTFLYGSHTEW